MTRALLAGAAVDIDLSKEKPSVSIATEIKLDIKLVPHLCSPASPAGPGFANGQDLESGPSGLVGSAGGPGLNLLPVRREEFGTKTPRPPSGRSPDTTQVGPAGQTR